MQRSWRYLSLCSMVLVLSACGSESSSTSTSTTPPADPTPIQEVVKLVAPTDVTVQALSSNSIQLRWSENNNAYTGYEIEQSSNATTGFALAGTTVKGVTEYTHSGLTAGASYFYRVRVVKESGNGVVTSPYSSIVAIATPPDMSAIPAAASALTASSMSSTQINLAWSDNSNNETGFRVERAAAATGPFSSLVALGANATSYTNTNLTASTTYYYRVIAFNASGSAAPSNVASATTMAQTPTVTIPIAPSNATATSISTSQINVAWSDNSTDETGFLVERATVATGPFTQVASLSNNATTFSAMGLSASTTYYFRVRAFNSAGNSNYTNVANATTKALVTIPNAPSGAAASTVSATQINLSWTDNSTDETGFVVQRGTSASGPFTQIASLGANVVSYSNTGLTAATTYYYRVAATNSVGTSSFSNTASATTSDTAPAAPSNASAATISASQINITWTDNSSNETGFALERAASSAGPYTQIAALGANVTSYSNTGLTASTTYYYRVKANNSVGSSAYSNVTSATTSLVAPAAPSSAAATVASTSQINLTWVDNSNNETNFNVERATAAAGPFTQIAALGANVTSYSSTGLAASTTYYFRVRASNSAGSSAYSNTASATTATANRAPVANAGADATVNVGTSVTLDGSGSSDADQDALTYAWSLTVRPGGSMAALLNPTTVRPSFTPDVAGSYTAQLIVNDGKVNSAADTVVITANAVAVSCDSLKPEFQTITWAQVLKTSCLGCHQSVSNFRLVPETTAGFNDTNFANFKLTAAKTGGNNISLMLTKPANLDGDHGGGQVIMQGSTAYNTLQSMVNKTKSCVDTPTTTTGLVSGTSYYRLRKATLSLAGRLPTTAEETTVNNAGTNTSAVNTAINGVLDSVMNSTAFYTRLKEIYNDMLLTDYYTVSGRGFFLDTTGFPNRTYFDSTNLTNNGYSAADASTIRNNASFGLGRSPLELVAYLVANNRPITEIVTADYVMVNSYSATIFGATVAGDANFPFKYGDAATLHDPNVFKPAKLVDTSARPVDHAGVLSTLSFLYRYPSTATNRNRARSRVTFEYFLDTDVQGLADRAALNFDNVIGTFPTLEDPQCTVCHNVVDPVAGLFKNYGNSGGFLGNVTNWFNTRNPKQMLDPGYTMSSADILPSTQSASALQFLGQHIAADNRFAVATVKTMLRGMMGDTIVADTLFVEQMKQALLASNYNLKSLIKAIVASDRFTTVNLGSSENPANYPTLGMPVLSTPEQLDRKITAITGGYQWKSPSLRTLLDINTYLMLYGGIDGMDVTERTRDATTIMTAIQERVAYASSCNAVPADFAKATTARALFPGVAITDLPDNGTGTTRIKQGIQYLYKRVLGEERALTDAEITRAYDLFVAAKAKATTANIPQDCAGTLATTDPIRVDTNGTVRSWMAVLAYLMLDFKFVYE